MNNIHYKNPIRVFFLICIGVIFSSTLLEGQNVDIQILNKVIDELVGEHKNQDINNYETLEDACQSDYVTCSKTNQVIGLDFQFANLNGSIPQDIILLSDLEYINLEYNYLSGSIPEGFENLKFLEELSFAGNFLSGDIPVALEKINKQVLIDLKRNSFKNDNNKLIKRLNIINQINIDECRSPDSIFLEINNSEELLTAVKPNNDSEVEKVVSHFPLFPGCENQDLPYEEMKSCAQNMMLQFIYKNLRYPAIARELNIEGMAVVQFVVLKNGDIGQAKVIRNPGKNLGNASLWVVNRMNYICDKWLPGVQDGKEVNVLYTLPVRFKLE